jgi:plasmid stabilization system protein ParE
MPRVVAALEQQVTWLRNQGAPEDRITGWLESLFAVIDNLYESPRLYPVAADETAEIGVEIRRVIFGDYLIYFHVDDDRGVVSVLHFRSAAHETNRITAKEVGE